MKPVGIHERTFAERKIDDVQPVRTLPQPFAVRPEERDGDVVPAGRGVADGKPHRLPAAGHGARLSFIDRPEKIRTQKRLMRQVPVVPHLGGRKGAGHRFHRADFDALGRDPVRTHVQIVDADVGKVRRLKGQHLVLCPDIARLRQLRPAAGQNFFFACHGKTFEHVSHSLKRDSLILHEFAALVKPIAVFFVFSRKILRYPFGCAAKYRVCPGRLRTVCRANVLPQRACPAPVTSVSARCTPQARGRTPRPCRQTRIAP